MALIKCPECGNQVSDKATACIHCGAPLAKEKNIIKIKTPSGDRVIVRVKYIVTDDKTGKELAIAGNGEVISLELDEPTTIRVHLGRGFKDATIDYVPNGTQKYAIKLLNAFIGARLSLQEIDTIDSDT